MPTGLASARRNAAAASGSGAADDGGPGGIRVRSISRWAGIFVVPQLTMNSWVCAMGNPPSGCWTVTTTKILYHKSRDIVAGGRTPSQLPLLALSGTDRLAGLTPVQETAKDRKKN